jgi:high-affinity Fe2+/Pb2+ permease
MEDNMNMFPIIDALFGDISHYSVELIIGTWILRVLLIVWLILMIANIYIKYTEYKDAENKGENNEN